MVDVSLVVPVFNNRSTLGELDRQLTVALDDLQLDWQVTWIDDASSDGSWDWIRARCEQDSRHRGLRLERNCGQSLTVCVGLAHAPSGAVVVTMDADLEYSTDDLAGMLSACSGPRVFVAGTRPRESHRTWTSTVFNLTTRVLTGDRAGDVGCGFMAIGHELVADAGRADARGLALRPYLSDHATATVRRNVRYEPAGVSGTGHRLRARIAFDVLAADPRPVRRVGLVAAVVLAVGSLSDRPAGLRTAGILAALTALALGLRRAVLRRRLATEPPRVAEVAAVPARVATTQASGPVDPATRLP